VRLQRLFPRAEDRYSGTGIPRCGGRPYGSIPCMTPNEKRFYWLLSGGVFLLLGLMGVVVVTGTLGYLLDS
jgi:hypothetical protein